MTRAALPSSGAGLVFANETLFVIARLTGYFAVALGPVSLVSVAGSTQVFFGVAYGWLLNLVVPSIAEPFSILRVTKKLLLGVAAIIGVYLLQ